jgi:PAS domain S-box-containing protein
VDASGELQFLLFDRNPCPMWIFDAETLAFLAVNEAAIREYGHSREEFLSMTIRDIRPPEDVPLLLAYLSGATADYRPDSWRHRKKDGSLVDVTVTTSSLEFHGRPARLALIEDVTGRLRERRQREESERQLLRAQQLAQLGSWQWDLQTGATGWSEELARICGDPPGSPAPGYEAFLQRVHAEDRDRLAAIVAGVLADGRPVPVDFRIVRADGEVRWLHAYSEASFDDAGRPNRLIGFAQDITGRKTAEEEVAETERRMRQIAEAIQDVFYLSDARTDRVLYVNPAFEKVWGRPAETILAQPRSWLEAVHPHDRERIQASLERFKPSSESPEWSEEFRILRPDGAVRWLWVRSFPIRSRKGEVVRFAGVERDITERRQAEDTIRSLLRITWELNATLDVDALMEELVKETLNLVGAASGCAGLRTTEGMLCQTFFRGGERVPFRHCWPAGRGLPGRMLGAAACVRGGEADIDPELRDRFGVRSAICAPLVDARWAPLGFFMLCDRKDGQPFGRDDEEKLMAVAQAASVAIQNALAYRKLQEAAEALQAAEAKYRDIFESATFGIGQSTPDGGIRAANPALARMLGYDSPEELIASIDDLGRQIYVDQKRREEGRRILEQRGSMSDFEAELRRRDGSTIWASMTLRSVRDGSGAVLYFEGAIQDVTQRKRAEDLLREVSGRLLQTQSEERRRIARELHDSTAQSLAALALNLGLVARSADGLGEAERQRLDDSQQLAQQCCREIRTLSYLLHPPALDETDLWSAVRWYAEGFTRRSGIKVDLTMPRGVGRLPQDVETTLFRIVQESLANIHRHSRSRQARIRIARRAAHVTLTVRDQGRGMPPLPAEDGAGETPPGGHAALGVGIAGMRERVRQLGGRFEIDSDPRGTSVRVEIPLSAGH